MHLQNEQYQKEIEILKQQYHQNMSGERFKKLVNAQCFGIFAPSKSGQTLLVFFKREKMQKVLYNFWSNRSFPIYCKQEFSSSHLISKIQTCPFYIQSLKASRPPFYGS